ncbi:MAG: IS30 family transposase, partial [Patescibacteria group bacterium]
MSHFTLIERKTLEKSIRNKISYEKIGQIIGKVKSSISDEIKNNSIDGRYDAEIAHIKVTQRK